MRALEESLKVPLFERKPRGVTLTAAGAELLGTVDMLLDRLQHSVRRIRNVHQSNAVSVLATHALAQFWLFPKLIEFNKANAERLAAGKAYTNSGYVVVDELGEPVHPEWYSDEFGRLAKRAGVKRIVLHEGRRTHGFGAELVARLTEEHFAALKAAPLRIASLDLPVPFAPELEHAFRPTKEKIIDSIAAWIG